MAFTKFLLNKGLLSACFKKFIYPASIYLSKVNNGNARTMCEILSLLLTDFAHCSCVSIVDFSTCKCWIGELKSLFQFSI